MPRTASPPRTARRVRIRKGRVAGLVVALVAIVALGHPWPKPSDPSSSRIRAALHHVLRPDPPAETGGVAADHRRGLGDADGAVPAGTSVFDDGVPGVAKLDADLLSALRRAANDAAAAGIHFTVDSGWRSAAYQERLLQEAIAKYGSEAEARRWVATPATSAHVKGEAVDIGPTAAAAWLDQHGAAYGLCRIYGNEPWHFELRPAAVGRGCPALYADPTQDPRMHQ